MIIITTRHTQNTRTDAPPHQLDRVARDCAVGLAQLGGHGIGRNRSGDMILDLSTGNKPQEIVNDIKVIRNGSIRMLSRAASEDTEEAILNSMVARREGQTVPRGIDWRVYRWRRKVRGFVERYRVSIDDESCLTLGEYPALQNKGFSEAGRLLWLGNTIECLSGACWFFLGPENCYA